MQTQKTNDKQERTISCPLCDSDILFSVFLDFVGWGVHHLQVCIWDGKGLDIDYDIDAGDCNIGDAEHVTYEGEPLFHCGDCGSEFTVSETTGQTRVVYDAT